MVDRGASLEAAKAMFWPRMLFTMIVTGDWVAGSMVDCAVVTALEYGGVAPCFSMWFFVKMGVVHSSVVGEGEVEAGVGASIERSQFMPSPEKAGSHHVHMIGWPLPSRGLAIPHWA